MATMPQPRFEVGDVITFRPAPRGRVVTGPIDRVDVDEVGRVQYYVRIVHDETFTTAYWVWDSEVRRLATQLVLPGLEERRRM
jgi:hypothetical protein